MPVTSRRNERTQLLDMDSGRLGVGESHADNHTIGRVRVNIQHRRWRMVTRGQQAAVAQQDFGVATQNFILAVADDQLAAVDLN